MDTIAPTMTIPAATSQSSRNTSRSDQAQPAEARIALAVGILGEAFRQRISKATVEAYRIGLCDLPIDAIERAVHEAIRTGSVWDSGNQAASW